MVVIYWWISIILVIFSVKCGSLILKTTLIRRKLMNLLTLKWWMNCRKVIWVQIVLVLTKFLSFVSVICLVASVVLAPNKWILLNFYLWFNSISLILTDLPIRMVLLCKIHLTNISFCIMLIRFIEHYRVNIPWIWKCSS